MTEKLVHFYTYQTSENVWSAAISKQSICFKAEQPKAVTGRRSDSLQEKAVITGIIFQPPLFSTSDKSGTVLNLSISIKEHAGPMNDNNFTLRFQKVLLNLKEGVTDISVEPPVVLIPGKTFSIIVEDLSTSKTNKSFRKHHSPFYGKFLGAPKREAKNKLEDANLVLNEIKCSTEYYSQIYGDVSEEIAMIRGIINRLV